MTILFNDLVQELDVPDTLKSASLAETMDISSPLIITFPKTVKISAIGIGNTDGVNFNISFIGSEYLDVLSTQSGVDIVTNNGINIDMYTNIRTKYNFTFQGNGLYSFDQEIEANGIIITTDATFIGRLGAGKGIKLCTAIAKQPGWHSTSEPRVTLSGQIVPGAGGYICRTLSLDTRYKMGSEAVSELQAGYKYIGLGLPFFIDLTDEAYKLPYSRLYATENNQRAFSLEGGIKKYLYSRRFEFTEAF